MLKNDERLIFVYCVDNANCSYPEHLNHPNNSNQSNVDRYGDDSFGIHGNHSFYTKIAANVG